MAVVVAWEPLVDVAEAQIVMTVEQKTVDSVEGQTEELIAYQMKFAWRIAETIGTDLIVTESAAAAVADTSVLKGDVATAADKCTAVSSGTAAVAVVELPVAFLGSASENWQTYLKAPLVPLNSLLSSVECQRCSASQSSGQQHFAWEFGSN